MGEEKALGRPSGAAPRAPSGEKAEDDTTGDVVEAAVNRNQLRNPKGAPGGTGGEWAKSGVRGTWERPGPLRKGERELMLNRNVETEGHMGGCKVCLVMRQINRVPARVLRWLTAAATLHELAVRSLSKGLTGSFFCEPALPVSWTGDARLTRTSIAACGCSRVESLRSVRGGGLYRALESCEGSQQSKGGCAAVIWRSGGKRRMHLRYFRVSDPGPV